MHKICKRIRQAQQDVQRANQLVELRVEGPGLKKVHWVKARRKYHTLASLVSFLATTLKPKSQDHHNDIATISGLLLRRIHSPNTRRSTQTYYYDNNKEYTFTIN